ncbi:MAG TPA: UDP-3-O-(3-hydroxymyristoyl)glucosamine N-acyltransferase [Rickettsiales bacterium]|nr:UDP-3-O-(3-hydroxymyristoyl)glucosamine N-acyltransferase [Rickettsiales bacterium]
MSDRLKFFNKKVEFLTLAQILEITASKLVQQENLQTKIYDIATLQKARSDQISFLNSAQYLQKANESEVGFCFIEEKLATKITQKNIILLINKNPYFAYSQIAAAFYQEKRPNFSQDLIHKTAKIGKDTNIAPSAYIGALTVIGKNCTINPNVTIYDNCMIGDNCIINASAVISFAKIGNNCIIHNGVKIGQDGFGFAHNNGINHKIIQLGIVEIGNNVEIGANTCIDRGTIENTKIADDVKIDNLVQVGHNVEIGQGSVLAGCTAIAGSTKIGKFVQIGGGSAINGHIEIGDGVKIAGMSGVIRSVKPMQIIGGAPALPFRQWLKLNAKLIKMSKDEEE